MKKKINLRSLLPHGLVIILFLAVTIIFFRPLFFNGKTLIQHDIDQFLGASHSLMEYRETNHEEGLWADNMFSGMPAYLVNMRWSNQPIGQAKKLLAFFLPHPVANIFIALVCFYVLALAFRVRVGIATAAAIAFGFSSYIIVGLSAGHNARIGAMAFMPLVLAGVHLAFTGRRIFGAGLAGLALALHLRENHLQMTYYLLFILFAYAMMQLIVFYRERQIKSYFATFGLLAAGATLAAASFIGPMWAVSEYSQYSIRGKSEILPKENKDVNGLSKAYAFEYSNSLMEQLTLFVPNIYGGASSAYLAQNEKTETYKTLMGMGNAEQANQLAAYTSAYWGEQGLSAPYYGGILVCLLAVLGCFFIEKKYRYYLLTLVGLGIVLSLGKNFPALNYFLFDYLPGFNKFRSATFALVITLIALPLMAALGAERFITEKGSKTLQKKLFWACGIVGGFCLLLWFSAGMFDLMRSEESQLPAALLRALREDRADLLRSDAFRALVFIIFVFPLLWLRMLHYINDAAFAGILTLAVIVDMQSVDYRYITAKNYRSKRENPYAAPNEADRRILQDKRYYRVYNLLSPFNEARTSYWHRSIGGYSAAKIRRYQDVYDSLITQETARLIQGVQKSGAFDFTQTPALNMLNAKYAVFGERAEDAVVNPHALGAAWFVRDIHRVNSPLEELQAIEKYDLSATAIVDAAKFQLPDLAGYDTLSHIEPILTTLPHMQYKTRSAKAGLAVFSEIYYPLGWQAAIDGQPVEHSRVNYVLRALPVPAGEHTIDFTFAPAAYVVGNEITRYASWLVIGLFIVCVGYVLREQQYL